MNTFHELFALAVSSPLRLANLTLGVLCTVVVIFTSTRFVKLALKQQDGSLSGLQRIVETIRKAYLTRDLKSALDLMHAMASTGIGGWALAAAFVDSQSSIQLGSWNFLAWQCILVWAYFLTRCSMHYVLQDISETFSSVDGLNRVSTSTILKLDLAGVSALCALSPLGSETHLGFMLPVLHAAVAGHARQARLVFSVLFTVLLWRMAAFAVGSEYIVGFAQAIGADPANNLASIVGRIVPQIVFWGMIVLFLTILNMIRRHHRQVTELHIQLLAETDQRMIQEALRFNYEEATESLGMAMYAMDRLGRFTYANPRFQTRFAVPLMEIIGKSWLEFMPKREAQVYENSERRVLGGTSTYQGYEPNPFGGGVVWASKSPIRGADGSVSGLVGVFIEGTPLARYHAQLALASSEPLNGLAMRNQYWQQGAVLDKRGDAQGLLRINFPYVPTVVELLSAMAAIHSAYAHIEFFLNATVAALETVDSVIESDDPTSVIARVRFDSPGFFEILAKMNPLKIIVDHLEFRQKHKETVKLNKPKIKKLHADAIRAEMEANESAMKTELIRNKVIKERLKMLEEQGVPADVRQKLLLRFVTSKLDIVGDYQEKGLIGVTTIIDSPSSALHDDHVIDE